jgi:hypothetical protein
MPDKTPPTLPAVLDELLPCNCGINLPAGKHYEDCPKAFKQAILTAVRQFVVDIIGEDEVFIDIPIADHTGKVTSRIDGNSYTPFMVARNYLRAEQRKQLLTALGEEQL